MPDMPNNDLLQILFFFAVLIVLAVPLGAYIANIYNNKLKFLSPVENIIYKLGGVDRSREMRFGEYTASIIIFSLIGFVILFGILFFQHILPLNPQKMPGLSWHLALNIAISFITNTNWQSYGGESTLSYFSQMVGLTVQNFFSAAAGMAVLAALARGFSNKNSGNLGNFWVDVVRTNLYILLPLSIVLAFFLVSQGVVQTFKPYEEVKLIDTYDVKFQSVTDPNIKSETISTQTLPLGPAASQVAIKQLGTNGGGFFNTNSAHPYENPTALSNFIEMLAILLIPAALCFSFGTLINDKRQGRALIIAMFIIFIPLFFISYYAELSGNPKLNILITPNNLMSAPNIEGKELRLGVMNSALWGAATTAASNGSVNAMHASFTPISGFIQLTFMQLGEVIFGGVGSGLYGMIVFALITVFICGLMVGRTPEYLGKKIQAFEMQMSSIVILLPCAAVLLGTSIVVLTEVGRSSMFSAGSQGFTEVLYAFTSAANNNGSAFAGLNANTPFYNVALAICMLIGRFAVMIPVLAIAGSLSQKNIIPTSNGTLPTHNWLFILLLVGIIIIVSFLTYVPSLVLGPVVEHLKLF